MEGLLSDALGCGEGSCGSAAPERKQPEEVLCRGCVFFCRDAADHQGQQAMDCAESTVKQMRKFFCCLEKKGWDFFVMPPGG